VSLPPLGLITTFKITTVDIFTVATTPWENCFKGFYKNIMSYLDRLCGLVVSIADYKHRGPGFDFRTLLRTFLRELGLERGPLSLVIG
jgi:hypothetical protein